MLDLTGRGTARTCDGITRRDFLQVGTLGAIGLSLPELAAATEAGKVRPGHETGEGGEFGRGGDRAALMVGKPAFDHRGRCARGKSGTTQAGAIGGDR